MRQGPLLFGLLLTILLPGVVLTAQVGEIDDLVGRSSLVFSGELLKLTAAATTDVPVDSRTAVVRVEETFTPTASLGDLEGREVTVRLGEQPASQGERAVFFTQSWIYGEGIALVELHRIPLEGETDGVRSEIEKALARNREREVRERVERADLIVAGKVVEVRPLGKILGPISEHSPDWREAVIQVETVYKGDPRTRELKILFPASQDEAWFDAPKFEPGQDGVWLLQIDQQEKGAPTARAPGYTALDADDYWGGERRTYIERLLGERHD